MSKNANSFAHNEEFAQIFDEHIGTVFARQLALADFLKVKEEPAINLEQGCVEFSNGQKYAVELLGTQLEDDTFWWVWSDENVNVFQNDDPHNAFRAPFSANLLQIAQQIKALGEDRKIDALAQPKVVLELSSTPLVPDEFNGDHIACLAAGLFNKAYWRDTRNEGVVYYLIKNTPAELTGSYTTPHILNTIEQVTSYFATNNKMMVESFLQQQGFTGKWEEILQTQDDEEEDAELGSTYIAQRGDEEITAVFDEDNALIEIEAHGFEGEEDYQNMSGNEGDFDMDDLLGQWGGASDHVAHLDPSGEFPPPLPPSIVKK